MCLTFWICVVNFRRIRIPPSVPLRSQAAVPIRGLSTTTLSKPLYALTEPQQEEKITNEQGVKDNDNIAVMDNDNPRETVCGSFLGGRWW